MRHRETVSEARRRGTDAGRSAASWVFDGNTTDEHRAKVAQMLADGDPALDGYVSPPNWLSGECAGESVSELLGDLLPENDPDGWKEDEILGAYCDAADVAFWHTVEADSK